jgi:hypothetical protein
VAASLWEVSNVAKISALDVYTPMKIPILIPFLFLAHSLFSQHLDAVINDSVTVEAVPFRGDIQWQISVNQVSWDDIEDETSATLTQKIEFLPVYFRAKIVEGSCEPFYSEIVSIAERTEKLWSDPATWNGSKPVAGQTVVIPAGTDIVLDENTPALGGLTIEGKLTFAAEDLSLTAKYILVHGTLEIGTESNPFTHNAVITLNDDNTTTNIMGMGTRGVIVMGGTLELHGNPPPVVWTKINKHAMAGATTMELQSDVSWNAGDEIVVAPTDYYLAGNSASVTQRLTLTNAIGNVLTLNNGLNAFRWGLLQYATTSGLSLTPSDLIISPAPDTPEKKTPTVLDERAEVGHLTRNIVIQAPNDGLWTSQGFGVHIMIGPSSTAHVEGVEIRRGGQRGRLARYPFHWHQLSYSGTQTLPDASGQYFRKSTINTSANRGVVLHGINGVLIKDNVIYDVRGHAVFTEDAVERRNVIDGNLVLYVRNSTQPLKIHEGGGGSDRGSAGFWISNPDNTIINNVAADCRSNGFWLPFPAQPWGLNSSVLDARDGLLLNPSRQLFGVFDNNTAHSNGAEGILLDDVEISNEGDVFPLQYYSTTNGRNPVWPLTTLRRFKLTNYRVWKNNDNGIWDRSTWVDNYGVVSADNCGRFFAGAGADGVIEHSLVVGTSLNHLMNGTGRPSGADYVAGRSSSDPAAFATYHSTFDIKNNIVINFPPVQNMRTGVFATDDYYERPVDKGQVRNINNLIQNSHPGVKLYPPTGYTWFALAGALWDPQGIWGPAGNYVVYNTPFYTHSNTVTQIAPSADISGGVGVGGPFYGVKEFVLHGVGDEPPKNQPYYALMGLHVRRLDQAMDEVGTWTIPPPPPGPGQLLPNKRHFAARPDAIYELTFPQEPAHPTDFQMNVDNMLTTDDQLLIGIQYDGAITATVRMFVYNGRVENYQKLGSLAEVRASAGATFWQDNTNHRVWVKMRGGYWQFWTTDTNEAAPSSDDLLYETTTLQIRPQ